MSTNGHDVEQQQLPAPVPAQEMPAIDQITTQLKDRLEQLHTTMFKNLDVRKDYIDKLKSDLDARYTAIVNAIDSYGQYVKVAGESMDRHDETMETISNNAGVVGLDAVSTAIDRQPF